MSPRAASAAGLDPRRLPRHVAIIMDGNGRWAKRRGWVRVRGHRQGASTVRAITTACATLGIPWLTLFAFSSENHARPAEEVTALMSLLEDYLDGELPTLREHEVRLRAIGRLHRLPASTRAALDRVVTASAGHRRMTLCLALSYGGRDELTDACRAIAERVARGELSPGAITDATLAAHLYAPDAPDVDLLIRTAGEQRLSNFLPWQSHYAEYLSAAPFWPDFSVDDLHAAFREYQGRDRRFGRVAPAGA